MKLRMSSFSNRYAKIEVEVRNIIEIGGNLCDSNDRPHYSHNRSDIIIGTPWVCMYYYSSESSLFLTWFNVTVSFCLYFSNFYTLSPFSFSITLFLSVVNVVDGKEAIAKDCNNMCLAVAIFSFVVSHPKRMIFYPSSLNLPHI